MNKVEDRTTEAFKAQERTFYSDLWCYNDRIKEAQNEKEKKELEIERQVTIDQWKEKHGQYNEDMTKWSIKEAVEHERNGTGLGAMQKQYDENQYGHALEQEEEYDDDYQY